MRRMVFNFLWLVAIALIASISTVDNAFAVAVAVPGPLAGVGLPVVAVVGVGYWLVRKLRKRK